MVKNTIKKRKTKKFWAIFLLTLGGLALILGSGLGINYSKLSKNALSLETKANAMVATDFIKLSTINEDGGGIPFSVEDYIYFPSINDVKNGGNYGFLERRSFSICAPTDWGIANGGTGILNDGRPGPLKNSINPLLVCYWWSRSAPKSYSIYQIYSKYDNIIIGYSPQDFEPISRCALHFKLQPIISALSNGTATLGKAYYANSLSSYNTYNTITLENLMYPQTKVTDATLINILDTLDTSYQTGIKYLGKEAITGYGTGYDSTKLILEYKYQSKYYVKVPEYANNRNSTLVYNDGTPMGSTNGSTSIWINVEPITWVIPPSVWEIYGNALTNKDASEITSEDSMEVFSLYGLVSGMFWQNNNSSDWTDSYWRSYLNGTNQFENYGFIDTIYHNVPTKVTKPTLSSTNFALNGSSFSIIDKFSGFNANQMHISGDVTVSTVGNYTTIISLKKYSAKIPGWVWSDGTDTSITYAWTLLDTLTKPTLKDISLTYNSSAITITDSAYCLNFDSTTMTALGNVTKTDAGNYEVVFAIKDSNLYYWEDGTNSPFSLSWSIKKASVTKPTLSPSSWEYSYGTTRNITSFTTGYDSSLMTALGDVTKTNAGEYNTTFALNDTNNYEWSDGTTVPVNLSWSITRKVLNTPAFDTSEFTFSTTTHNVLENNNITGFDNELMTLSGTGSAIKAGTYYVFVYLKDSDNFRFKNGQTFAILTWTITPYALTDENTSITTGE